MTRFCAAVARLLLYRGCRILLTVSLQHHVTMAELLYSWLSCLRVGEARHVADKNTIASSRGRESAYMGLPWSAEVQQRRQRLPLRCSRVASSQVVPRHCEPLWQRALARSGADALRLPCLSRWLSRRISALSTVFRFAVVFRRLSRPDEWTPTVESPALDVSLPCLPTVCVCFLSSMPLEANCDSGCSPSSLLPRALALNLRCLCVCVC